MVFAVAGTLLLKRGNVDHLHLTTVATKTRRADFENVTFPPYPLPRGASYHADVELVRAEGRSFLAYLCGIVGARYKLIPSAECQEFDCILH